MNQRVMPLRRALFRNGFGVDLEIVDHLPLWVWGEDSDVYEDDPDVGVFEGFVITVPFCKIFVGKLFF